MEFFVASAYLFLYGSQSLHSVTDELQLFGHIYVRIGSIKKTMCFRPR